MDLATTVNLGRRLVGRKPSAPFSPFHADSHPALSRFSGCRWKPKQLLVSPKRNFLPARNWCSTRRRPSRHARLLAARGRSASAPACKVGSGCSGQLGVQTSRTAKEGGSARLQPELELLTEGGFSPPPLVSVLIPHVSALNGTTKFK